MKKIVTLLFLLGLLFGCEYKTIDIEYTYHNENGIVAQVKHWEDTIVTYNIALKMTLPHTEHNYLTIIRSLDTNQEYEFHDCYNYKRFREYENHKVKLSFKHTIKTQENKDSDKRTLVKVDLDQIYLVED